MREGERDVKDRGRGMAMEEKWAQKNADEKKNNCAL